MIFYLSSLLLSATFLVSNLSLNILNLDLLFFGMRLIYIVLCVSLYSDVARRGVKGISDFFFLALYYKWYEFIFSSEKLQKIMYDQLIITCKRFFYSRILYIHPSRHIQPLTLFLITISLISFFLVWKQKKYLLL